MTVSDSLELTTTSRLPPGWRGEYWSALASTQDVARAAPPRSIVVADFQSAGRGRHGRVWTAPPGTSLLVSMVLQQDGPPSIWRSTGLAAVALVGAVEALLPNLRPSIKWPNDVLLDGGKVAGILAESTWDGTRARIIVGVGVNVTTRPHELEGLGSAATSLFIASGRRIDRGELLRVFLGELDQWLERPEAELRARWQARLWGQGQRLRLVDVDGEQEVIVLGAEHDGSLRVRLPDGSERTTATGEIII